MAGTETRYCANCGERISARSRFCPACGARQEDFLVADPEPVGAPPEPEPTPPEPEPTSPAPEPVPPPAPPPPEPAPAPRAEPLRERIGRVDPQAGELSGLLMGHLAVPGVMAAGLAALAASAIVLVAGVLIALATPDASILGVVGRDGGL
ncbi:MAG: zinc ribbon domain-containing protein, partial [Solirubrobacteraceae bacterium]